MEFVGGPVTSLETVGVAPKDGDMVGDLVGMAVGWQISSDLQVDSPDTTKQHSSSVS